MDLRPIRFLVLFTALWAAASLALAQSSTPKLPDGFSCRSLLEDLAVSLGSLIHAVNRSGSRIERPEVSEVKTTRTVDSTNMSWDGAVLFSDGSGVILGIEEIALTSPNWETGELGIESRKQGDLEFIPAQGGATVELSDTRIYELALAVARAARKVEDSVKISRVRFRQYAVALRNGDVQPQFENQPSHFFEVAKETLEGGTSIAGILSGSFRRDSESSIHWVSADEFLRDLARETSPWFELMSEASTGRAHQLDFDGILAQFQDMEVAQFHFAQPRIFTSDEGRESFGAGGTLDPLVFRDRRGQIRLVFPSARRFFSSDKRFPNVYLEE